MSYQSYKRWCEAVSDLQGRKIFTNLQGKEITNWEQAINELKWLDK